MAGTLVLDTLKDGSGNSVKTTDPIKGSLRAWVHFGATGTITASYNVSSVTKNASGDWTLNFTTALTDANYGYTGFASFATAYGIWFWSGATTKTASAFRVLTGYASNTTGTLTAADYTTHYLAIFGN
jgi:hypothetical protein